MKKFLSTLAIGAVIVTALILLTEWATRDKSTAVFVNGSDHNIFVEIISRDVGTNERVSLDMRPISIVHVSLKKGQYLLLYRTYKEFSHNYASIKLERNSRYKFVEIDGELVFNDKPK